MKKEYVQAAIDRIKDWCKTTDCEITDIAYVAIRGELGIMFEISSTTNNLINEYTQAARVMEQEEMETASDRKN